MVNTGKRFVKQNLTILRRGILGFVYRFQKAERLNLRFDGDLAGGT